MPDALQTLLEVVELFQLPVEVVAPVNVSGLASAVAVHNILVDLLVLIFDFGQVLLAPLHLEEALHLLLLHQVIPNQLA